MTVQASGTLTRAFRFDTYALERSFRSHKRNTSRRVRPVSRQREDKFTRAEADHYQTFSVLRRSVVCRVKDLSAQIVTSIRKTFDYLAPRAASVCTGQTVDILEYKSLWL